MKHISSLKYGICYNYILFEFLHLICFIVFFNLCPILVSTSIDVFWLMNNILFFLYRYSKKKKFREFQSMTFAPDDNSLSSDQNINQFLV